MKTAGAACGTCASFPDRTGRRRTPAAPFRWLGMGSTHRALAECSRPGRILSQQGKAHRTVLPVAAMLRLVVSGAGTGRIVPRYRASDEHSLNELDIIVAHGRLRRFSGKPGFRELRLRYEINALVFVLQQEEARLLQTSEAAVASVEVENLRSLVGKDSQSRPQEVRKPGRIKPPGFEHD